MPLWGHVLTASIVALCQAAPRAAAESASAEPTTTAVEIAVDAGGGTALGRHSEQLMGITAYGSPNFDQPAAQALVRELGIRSVGMQAVVTSFAPPNLSTAALNSWFAPDRNGSSAALRYANATFKGSLLSIVASRGIRAAGAEPWIYLKTGDGAKCKGTAAEGHCFTVAGTPKPDDSGDWSWWSTLFVGVFGVLRGLDPSLRYVHIWNEGNAHFWMDKFPNGSRVTGEWYAEFYLAVSTALAAAYPPTINTAGLPDLKTGIVIGGPVTYSPPFQLSGGKIDESTWTEWFEPVLRATADNPRLLGWVDFHAYDSADPHSPACQKPNCRNADAATIEMNLQEIALVGQALGRPGLLTSITETNFALESEADEVDW
jgi:hypothetical protein